MLEKQEYLEVGEEKYPLAVTLNVIETMQNKYGTITKWKKLMLGFIEEKKIDKKGNEVIEWKENDELSAKDLKFFVMESINEGIDIENEKRNDKRPFVTDRQVGRIISEVGSVNVLKKIVKALNMANSGSSEDENEKN